MYSASHNRCVDIYYRSCIVNRSFGSVVIKRRTSIIGAVYVPWLYYNTSARRTQQNFYFVAFVQYLDAKRHIQAISCPSASIDAFCRKTSSIITISRHIMQLAISMCNALRSSTAIESCEAGRLNHFDLCSKTIL